MTSEAEDMILEDGEVSADEEGKQMGGKRNREMREEEGESEPSSKKSTETLIKCVYTKCNKIQWNLIPKEIRNSGVNYTTCEAVEKEKHTSPHDDLLRLGNIFRGKNNKSMRYNLNLDDWRQLFE